jgi:hypothetical protein
VGVPARILESRIWEVSMNIFVTAAGMVRIAVVCFVLGIVLGVYFGASARPEAAVVVPPVDNVAPVNATAP